MKSLLVLAMLGALVGCSSLKGTMLDGQFCTVAEDKDIQAYIKVITEAAVPPEYKVPAAMAENLVKMSATSLCEEARAQTARAEAAKAASVK